MPSTAESPTEEVSKNDVPATGISPENWGKDRLVIPSSKSH